MIQMVTSVLVRLASMESDVKVNITVSKRIRCHNWLFDGRLQLKN